MTQNDRPPAGRRVGCLVVLAVLLVIGGFLAFRAFRAASAARSALQEVRALQALDRSALASLDPGALNTLRDQFTRLEADLVTVEREAAPFLPLSQGLDWLPGIGPEAAAAADLLRLGQQASTAGRAALDGASLVLNAAQDGQGPPLQRVSQALQQAGPYWQEADSALAEVATLQASLAAADLDPRIAAPLAQLDSYLPMLEMAVTLGQIGPALLGVDEPRTYLLLAQNSDELRPTGGFISGVGRMSIADGDLKELTFSDSYTVYNPNVDHPLAPPDLERTMGAQMLLFRDSNWSPDFPTTASVASSLYQLDTGVASDGVFAFDLEATRRLVGALQPLALPGYEEPVTADNLIKAMRDVWEDPLETENTVRDSGKSDWWIHRKDFMGDLAAAALARVESGAVDFGPLAQAVYASLQDKHILLNVADPATMALLEQAGWAGAVTPGDGDYLMVVDSNVGFNKVNGLVDRATAYRITPGQDGSAEVELRLNYSHGGRPTGQPCVQEIRYGDTYADMAERCYFNYLRVYAPAGARLLESSGFEPDSVVESPGEKGATQFAGLVVVPPGTTGEVVLRYQLPAGLIRAADYDLRIQKQPGVKAWSVSVAIDDPSGVWLLVGGKESARPAENRSTFILDLVSDVDLRFEKLR